MGKLLSNEDFLKKLNLVNESYRKGEFKVLSKVKKHPESLIVKDEFGYCKMTVNSLFKGAKPSLSSSIFPTNYIINKLSSINKEVYKRNITIVSDYIRDTNILNVKTKYGVCKSTLSNLYKNNFPSINSAIDKTEYFIKKSKHLTNNRFLYDNTVYGINGNDLVTITCKIHGDFKTSPNIHFQQKSCKKCSFEKQCSSVRLTNEEFKDKAVKVHGNTFDYSLVDYESSHKNVKIICKTHGVFEQSPNNHLNGSKCNKCTSEYKVGSLKWWCDVCKERDGIFYILRCFNDNEDFIKIGLTCTSIKERYSRKRLMPYEYDTLLYITTLNLKSVYCLEAFLKKKYKEKLYSPKLPFGGSKTECLKITTYENILQDVTLWAEENNINVKEFTEKFMKNLHNSK